MDIRLIITKWYDRTPFFPYNVQKRILIFDNNNVLLKMEFFLSNELDNILNKISQDGFKILAIKEIEEDNYSWLEVDNVQIF